ncbi:MAG: glutamate synthase subunit beta [Calditrichaceae bacterium]|nr:glutamate synthase subunit beta [Calditrichaceae bacterium]MBN2710574.1 glutamate synthase subunit beta [Calditrichaceae bacterium]RQV94116.1 MAG: glutamate synthase subunit beta [Calditrichota bacterium]
MGKTTGFLEYKRQTGKYQPVKERIKHYREFTILPDPDELSRQGARCMDCGIPFCHSASGCPVANLIPEWNDLVYNGLWREAYERLELTNNFPEFTGRVCPAPCETACTLAINDSPVSIKQIELAIIERAFSEGWVKPQPAPEKTGKKIAVIGSGPAGLAAAQQLSRSGHEVTVYEKSPAIGGLLRYGIPDFKLEKNILDRRLKQMSAEGTIFKTGIEIGEDLSARYLKNSFDVILLTMGAGQPRDLTVPGRDLKSIHFAMDYLTKSNLFVQGTIPESELISARNKNVLVIGGGDTGADCVGTANRQRAKNIYQMEILPKPKIWNETWNPEWPFWPNILRTSSSHEEGCGRDWAVTTVRFEGQNGQVSKANFRRVEWQPAKNGKSPVIKEIAGSDFELPVDLVLLAMGFIHVTHNRLLKDWDINFDERGNIIVDQKYMTSQKGVFCAGDACSGASLVVKAIFQGRQAAQTIDEYLK